MFKKRGFIKCFDCHQMVAGSIAEHHKVCEKSRKSKSEMTQQKPTASAKSKKRVKEGTKDLFCLLDVSGSMEPILPTAKQALVECFGRMEHDDRFSIVTRFSS